MQRSSKLIFCLLLIVSSLIVIRFPSAFSQEEEESASVKEISGDVASLDLKNSVIVIKQLKDEKSLTYETIIAYIDDSTSIERYYEAITIADIKVGDKVTVEYLPDTTGKNIAINIWVELKE